MKKARKKQVHYTALYFVGAVLNFHFVQEVEKLIRISKAQRNKKKIVTVVTGLKTFGRRKLLVQWSFYLGQWPNCLSYYRAFLLCPGLLTEVLLKWYSRQESEILHI